MTDTKQTGLQSMLLAQTYVAERESSALHARTRKSLAILVGRLGGLVHIDWNDLESFDGRLSIERNHIGRTFVLTTSARSANPVERILAMADRIEDACASLPAAQAGPIIDLSEELRDLGRSLFA